MQYIVENSYAPIEGKPSIEIMGAKLWLGTVDIGGVVAEGELSVGTFNDGRCPTCVVFVGQRGTTKEDYIFTSLADIGRSVFQMSEEDANIYEEYLLKVADNLSLEVIPVTGGMVVVSAQLQSAAKSGKYTYDYIETLAKENKDLYMATTNMGQATLLGEAVKTGTSRYNTTHYVQPMQSIANIIKSARRINEMTGDPMPLTIGDIEAMFSAIKNELYISSINIR